MTNDPNVELGMTPPASTPHTVDGGGEPAVMPIARAVPLERENEEDIGPAVLQQAVMVDDSNKKLSLLRNRKLQLCITFSVIAISVALAVGLTVGTTDGGGTVQPTTSPTLTPTSSPTTKEEIVGRLSWLLGKERSYLLEKEGSPQYKAKEWVVQEEFDIHEKNLHQSFTLASLYYSTTKEGNEWNFCGEVESGDEDYDCECKNRHHQWNTEKRWLTPRKNATVCEWCGVLCDAHDFVISLELLGNNLAGNIPPELHRLSKLKTLLVRDNNITGTIPSTLGEMTSLIDMQFQMNKLVGKVPEEIYNVTGLQSLTLSDNFLNGTISTLIGRLTALKAFHTSGNRMSGEFPSEIGRLKKLLFSYHSNNMYSGTLPTESGKLTELKELSVGNNDLNGTIPSEMGLLANMEVLILQQNKFEGIPEEIYNMENIHDLWLHRNKFVGTISPKVSQLNKVKKLLYSDNKLTGQIPTELGQLKSLTHLWLYWNNFSTSVPDEVCETKENRQDDKILRSLQADCKTTQFDSMANASAVLHAATLNILGEKIALPATMGSFVLVLRES